MIFHWFTDYLIRSRLIYIYLELSSGVVLLRLFENVVYFMLQAEMNEFHLKIIGLYDAILLLFEA